MALVVFLRGVNVGGYRTFRPSVLARELSRFDVVNVGAAGTFVARKPGALAGFKSELQRRLPFETEVALSQGRDLIELVRSDPFGAEPAGPGVVRFVSVLSRPGRLRPDLPIMFPAQGEWSLRVLGWRNRFVFGEYRRHMKAIGYLGRIDQTFGAPATTRNWNTIQAILRILEQS
jgi:uncharacterized protein (DUF1697 family)